MGTGASKSHTAEKQKTQGNEDKRIVPNGSASTLPASSSFGKQMGQSNPEEDEIAEDIEQMVQNFNRPLESTEGTAGMPITLEAEDVSLTFESFLHRNGTLYTCFIQNGTRLYFDDEKGIVPFPQELYSEGNFINAQKETQKPEDSKEAIVSFTSYLENERTSSFNIPGKGMVMTYIFEERINVCRYFDSETGVWLILPLLWEMNLDFTARCVQQVKEALPAIADYKEILAALRHCNYDPDEVISVFFAIFGDSVENSTSGSENIKELDLQRDLQEKMKTIDNLNKKLEDQEKELEALRLKCQYLEEEKANLIHQSEKLYKQVAELQAEHDVCLLEIDRIHNLDVQTQSQEQSILPLKKETLLIILRQARELNVCNYQLKAVTTSTLSEIGVHLSQLKNTKENFKRSSNEMEEIRALYKKESLERRMLYNQLQELRGNIRVFCRCRLDIAKGDHLEFPTDEEIIFNYNESKKKFQFDQVFIPNCSQEDVFEGTLPIIQSCADGYNVSILAYGQTGSGKTYTMMGTEQEPGVNIRSIRELLRICRDRVKVKYTTKLEIRSQGMSVIFPGLTEVEVLTEEDIRKVMSLGDKNRMVASTKMNTESSRSHLMVIFHLTGVDSISGVVSNATLTLCDLAGSERISKTEAKGQRLIEAAAINKSLTALGQVFSALKNHSLHVPYRNSKLTHLLQPSLSGHAKTCVFINISPNMKEVGETLSTLQFGSSIQQITLGKPTNNSSVKLGP
ncbi:hypothetical protein GDO86_005810 [Hymenochirus boettgeri]|uniref:Kinesin-like protein n=1 Tax=Hymenochirus boettgeri TaxID=247094 RepID=A0A8T2JB10_9PIPI|nr:hypothetical protein GDO86_005810 [Hymenochirus boettgeri]